MAALSSLMDSDLAQASGEPTVEHRAGLEPGDLVGGKYLLLRRLGAGGMGQVWLAENSSTGAEVAVKALLPELASSADALARFRDEAYATAQLAHRGIVRIFDLVELEPGEGSLLIVMELLRGQTLARYIETRGPLSIEETLAVALPLLSGLSHAHGVGVIHRDVKPENVFLALEPDGEVIPKLVDFGISQLRERRAPGPCEGLVVGTPWYMSPEQARGEEVDARCDVFCVGILLYECLSGTNPFRVEGATTAPLRPPPPLSSVGAGLWAVISRALAERPEDRFSTAADLAEALCNATEPRSSWSISSFFTSPDARPAWPHVRAVHAIALGIAMIAVAIACQGAGSPAASPRVQSRAQRVVAPHAPKRVAHQTSFLAPSPEGADPVAPSTHRRARRFDLAPKSGHPRCPELIRDPGF
jgi:serine/threonine protein kinase